MRIVRTKETQEESEEKEEIIFLKGRGRGGDVRRPAPSVVGDGAYIGEREGARHAQ